MAADSAHVMYHRASTTAEVLLPVGQAKSWGRVLIGPVGSAVVRVDSYKPMGATTGAQSVQERISAKENLERQSNHYVSDLLNVEQLLSGRFRIIN